MSKPLNPGKKTIELRPSRIRRDPPPAARTEKSVQPYPAEREVWIVVIGVILFALVISALMIGISDITSH